MNLIPKYIMNVLLTTAGAVGAVFCIITGFGLSVSVPVVILAALVSSMLFTCCFMWKKALWLLLPLVLGIVALSFFTNIFSSVSPTLTQFVHDVLQRFSSAYPNFSFAIPSQPDTFVRQNMTMLFSIIAMLLSIWMAWGVGYRSCLISVAGTLPFLLLCVVINDTPPHALPLVTLLSVWVTVLLSTERPGEPPVMDTVRMGLLLFAVALFLGLIGTAYPKGDTRDQELPELVEDFVDMLPEPLQDLLERDDNGNPVQELGADTSTVLDLTQQGTRDRSDAVMMQLSTTEVGPIYLRGAAKDIYTGTSWESSDMASSADSVYAHTSLGTAFGTVTQAGVQIKNYNDKDNVMFVPYGFISCTSAEDIVSDLRININEEDYIIYYWPHVRTMDLSTEDGYTNDSYDAYVESTCLSISRDAKTALYNLAVSYGYDPGMSTVETVAWVATFIRNSGTYRLNVSRQPVNHDFAVYFLTESNEGYCVHFATAAAAMFRALGIPARYASGYRVTVSETGTVVDVLDRDSHAWAEVYLSGLGWIPVETTPGFGETSLLPQIEQPTAPSPSPEQPEPTPSEVAPSPPPEEVSATVSPEESEAVATDKTITVDIDVSSSTQSTSKNRINILYIILAVPALLLLTLLFLLIRHGIVRRRRRKAFRHSNTNQAVLNMWQYLEKLEPWGAVIPKRLETLALKAKFSPHQITQEELSPYEASVYKIAATTEKNLRRGKHLRFKWLSCLDLAGKK